MKQTTWLLLVVSLLGACTEDETLAETYAPRPDEPVLAAGKADEGVGRIYQVLLNDPHCDVCTSADKSFLKKNSAIKQGVLRLIDGAAESIDVAQFTFSAKEIEAALKDAHGRGVRVRIVMDAAQDQPGRVATRLKDAGLDVTFAAGKASGAGGKPGLQHAKFMIVDGAVLLTGSNNWSSTGTSFNEENSIVIRSDASDPLISGFQCHFDKMRAREFSTAGGCSNGSVRFSPGSAARKMIRDAIRASETSVDVLMHHFTFTSLVKELRKAAERGVAIRVIVNASDRAQHSGGEWTKLVAAGGEIRFKQRAENLYQLMHHKLAIVDGKLLLNGSGNWSGSAFFNNYENYIAYDRAEVVRPFRETFARLWRWSLTAESLDGGRPADEQHASERQAYFGSLHGHVAVSDAFGHLLDDNKGTKHDEAGEEIPVPFSSDPYLYAFEYARDVGGLDFVALTPHTADPSDDASAPNMSTSGFAELAAAAALVNSESSGSFLGLAGMEWSTNSSGNHVNVLGSHVLSKVERGRFDLFYGQYVADRVAAGDPIILQLNHPKTFRLDETSLKGSWDQIVGVPLTDIPKKGERKKKFNDYGLDDFPPMSTIRQSWIDGDAVPDQATIDATLKNLRDAAGPSLRLMEVLLARGNEFSTEVPRNPSLVAGDEEGTLVRRTKVHSDFDYYLLRGFRLSPTAPHDNHYANWGTAHTSRTGVVAPALTEEAVLEALREGAVFASEDQNLTLRFYAGGREPMGGALRTLSSKVSLRLHLHDPDYAGTYEVRVWSGRVDGPEVREVLLRSGVGGDAWLELPITLGIPGQWFAYVEVTETDADRMAWSAPIWIEKLGSCGDGWCGSYEACGACESDCGECANTCGDGACDGGESCDSCAADCGACAQCGDGSCDVSESCDSCADDCGACESCGDGSCGDTEDCESCPVDCGACIVCGDGQCSETEGCEGCPEDCGACVVCGDGACDVETESCETCSDDCGACISCGDGACNGTETCEDCPADCGACVSCGDGACATGDETCETCPADCGPCAVCGDGDCAGGETCDTCPGDCGACVVCGDGACADQESCDSCPQDCGVCGGACCEAQSTAGCGNETVEACVCAKDAYCCDVTWDWLCRDEVTSFGCGACN